MNGPRHNYPPPPELQRRIEPVPILRARRPNPSPQGQDPFPMRVRQALRRWRARPRN